MMISGFNRYFTWLFLSLLAFSFCLWGYYSATQPLWADERLTAELVKSSSVAHMWSAIFDGLDATPPIYTLYGWFMLHYVVPHVEPSAMFRLTNALIVTAAIIILYILVRRFLCVIQSIIVISFFVLASLSNLLFLITELRTYALFVLATTIATYFSINSLMEAPSSRFLCLWISYCFLTVSHTF